MKTQPLRTDKTCLNCGTEVPERYCSHCGQENAVTHESFGHLLKHFVADIFHYDSQFFSTLKYLFFRPGFLSQEYMAGRRVRYVNPIKLYVFASFLFFFGVFTLPESEPRERVTVQEASKLKPDSMHIHGFVIDYPTVYAYDSAQLRLPPAKRASATERAFTRRLITLHARYGNDIQKVFLEMLEHNIPKLMFLLLPLFALYMRWMYNKRKWLYADHAIFAIHLHAFAYLLFLLAAILAAIFSSDTFISIASWILFAYFVLALHRNYGQSRWISFWKAAFLVSIYFLSMLAVFTGAMLLIFTLIL
ncbi:DUF3667 domain-containing protein [Chitinophaga vietnamensis]|uniref:DUF3667 domain-containing protein n=1 Tax=Chitinophaga vietnamensis TaxID=2593957 RepID=UPI0013754A4B|nr:DUF3667 domain-containing protein [Chitinophaga vietnamensis]